MGQVNSLWQRMRLLHLLPLLAVAIAQKRSYGGHQVLRVGPLDDESYFVLRDLQMTSNALDFWTEPAPDRTTDINIPPEGLASVKAWLEEKGISYSIMIEDLGPLSESNQPKKLEDYVPKEGSKYAMDWDTHSTPTHSCGCGPTAMTMGRTLKTTRRSSSWLLMPAMLSSRFTAPSLTQSTLLISTRLQEHLMTGTSRWE